MANGKNGSKAVMTEQERLAAFKSLGEALGTGEGSWEAVAYGLMEGVESNTWNADSFKSDDKTGGAAARILNAFYDGAASKNKRMIRPHPESNTFTGRVANLRAIGKAAARHDAKFRNMLQGTNGLIDGVLVKAIAANQKDKKNKRTLWSAFEAIYRAAVLANDKDHTDNPTLSKAEIEHCVWHKVKEKPEAETAFVDAVGRMVKTLKDATQGYTGTTGADKDVKHPAIFVDKELTDALKSLTIWHDRNAEQGSKKVAKKAVNFKTMSDTQLDVLRAQFNAELKERKAAAAATA